MLLAPSAGEHVRAAPDWFFFSLVEASKTKIENRSYPCFFIPLKVKKFPASIKSKATLRKVLTTLLWAFTGQHAATTYPILEYGGFVPNAPHRLFADSNGSYKFSNNMFGNKAVALVRWQFDLLLKLSE